MKRVLLLAVVMLALGASEAQAMDRGELGAAREAVVDYFVPALSPSGIAPHRIYGCGPHSCQFWVRGTSTCEGTVRVRGGRIAYTVWFKNLRCD